MSAPQTWYLIRTKANRETFVRERLLHITPRVFLPMLKWPVCSSRRQTPSLVPLFPQYIFVQLHLATHYFGIRYLPGVTGFVSTGTEPLEVSVEIVAGIRARCTDGVVQLRPKPFRCGEHVRMVEGPFRHFDAIFAGYLSGAKRVAILINAIQGPGVRVVTETSHIAAAH
jgi:transcriptional antiterminator RfaH